MRSSLLRTVNSNVRLLSTSAKSKKMASVGSTFPSGISLHEGNPGNAVSLDTLLAGKKVILFGVPGAFTPGCSKTHLPGYVADYEKLKQKNVDEIICTSVNDAFVMDAWGKDQHATGKVRMLADPNAELAKALGVTVDLKALGGIRSKRYSAIIENGVIKTLNVEPENGTGLTCSLANEILKQL